MNNIRVLVVDDSSFSRTIISDTLRERGMEVVGEADSLEALMAAYREHKPDVVTMDIAMPGADGFECSKILRLHDPEAKIVLVSSMKDDEFEAEARQAGIVGYVQKPVDGEVLVRVIHHVMEPETLFTKLQVYGLETFKEALTQNITRMTKTPVSFINGEQLDMHHISQGITAVIGIIGRTTGCMILDLSTETAQNLMNVFLSRQPKNREEVLAMVAEFANIVAGVACSMLNKMDKGFGLRVSPPSLFYGAPTEFVSPTVPVRRVYADTEFGRICMGVGFKKGATS